MFEAPSPPIPDSIPGTAWDSVRAGLLRVHSRKLEGARLQQCIRDAYDVFAGELAKVGEELTCELLTERIPAWVFDSAVQLKWIPYPPVRLIPGRGNMMEGWFQPSRYEPLPQAELTETFGRYMVNPGYKESICRCLASRMAHWQAEAVAVACSPHADGRSLAAIMFTDIVGYSAMTQRDEALAQEVLDEHNRVLRAIFSNHGGTEVKTTGDGFLVRFASALDAARCAIAIQQALLGLNRDRPLERRFQIRIGLDVGDVIPRGNDVFGDTVNVAARIMQSAEPGGIYLSGGLARQVESKLDARLENMGCRSLKNIQKPVELYRVVLSS